jgi:DNA polymerase III alpha subunit (gram-positive type)
LEDEVYLIIDIETSGLPKKTNNGIVYPEILQIAWILTNKKGVILKKNSFIIDTPFIKNNDSSEFVNVDFKTARKVSFPIKKILKKLKEDVEICDYVVAHNIEFDLEVLEHFFLTVEGVNPFKSKETICTMKSTINYCRIPNNYGFKYPKLSELFLKLFDYQINNSHNAEVDVLHTLKCFKKLKNLGLI